MVAPISTSDTPSPVMKPPATIQNPTYEDLSPPNSVRDYSVYDTARRQLSYDDNPETMSFKPPQVPFKDNQKLTSEIEASPEPVKPKEEVKPKKKKQNTPNSRLADRETYMNMELEDLQKIKENLEKQVQLKKRPGRPVKTKSSIITRILTYKEMLPADK